MKKGRVAILLSGRGSNFEALYHSSLSPDSNFSVVAVISDKKDAPGLGRAREFGLPAFSVAPGEFDSKDEYEGRLVGILQGEKAELICLAGYMRIVGSRLLNAYKDRILNIHPALLPSFPGLHAQKQALEYGVKVAGCTVHFIDSGVDTGPIIIQESVEVLEGDDEESLSQRILAREHKIYSRAVEMFFGNRLKLRGRKVIIS